MPQPAGALEHWMANLSKWVKLKITTPDRIYTWKNIHPTKIHCYFYDCGENDACLDLFKSQEALKNSIQRVLNRTDIIAIHLRERHTMESNQVPTNIRIFH